MTMKYNFDAGDYVETKGGSKGYISNPKTMWWTCTCEGSDGYNEGLSYTVAGLEKNNLAFFYNRIGSYDFTKKNIPNRIKPLDREYTKSFCFHKNKHTEYPRIFYC